MKLIESIKYKDGVLYNIDYHLQRMHKSCVDLFRLEKKFVLPTIEFHTGLYKLRLIYDTEIHSYTLEPYVHKAIEQLHYIHDDKINYKYKCKNRHCITKYNRHLPTSHEIIFIKNKLLTDSSYSNIVLFNGNEYHTPRTPLLHGTKRQQLLDEKKIIEKDIAVDDLNQYQYISFINALNDLDETIFTF